MSRFCSVAVFIILVFYSRHARAGILVSPGLALSSYSFAPIDEESTPNYWSIGPNFTLGYSFDQMFDLGLFFNYMPGAVNKLGLGQEDAFLYNLGMEAGFTSLKQYFKFKVKGSEQRYRGLKGKIENHVEGFWGGRAYGFSTLGVIPVDREFFIEVGVEVMRSSLSQDSQLAHKEKRALTYFSAIIGFTFNNFKPSFIETRLFKGII